ncbi:GTP-binding protein HflX [Persephonella hydrogeniphila]|uniref:GTPase HflX n=1 Tax=Persephonella hydrogeniphila TaxID=198703 RepID=A0A285NLX5_9AQUI|nr:GTPase HflX [Persephonella hydrogeniphila]SNZ09957.1 GTP-binding protein HflX [Persephonella hydrogeniphila]
MRCILVGVKTKDKTEKELKNSLSELEGLVEALNGKTLGKLYQKKEVPDPATFIGKGKAYQLKELAEGIEADTIVFDTDLSPVQITNIENITKTRVIDRTDLILSIFSERAKTRQAKLQVELATLQHQLPRVYGQKGKALSRIGGGMKTKGAGEKLGEIKVRRIKDRISKIKKELEQIKKQRKQQRKWRSKDPNILKVALVGYTNAGKSSLLNRLTKRDTFISDQLFATLDTKTSYIVFPDTGKKVVLTDTVGFVKDMPQEIMEAFMATLEEVEEADLLLHVVDVSDENWLEKLESVEKILKKINVIDKPSIVVLNKVDKIIPSPEFLDESEEEILTGHRDSVIISTEMGWNLDKLREKIKEYSLLLKEPSYYGGE